MIKCTQCLVNNKWMETKKGGSIERGLENQ
jgi:hypothetical protein